ncbi:MAG TPA: hypothetical protein VFS56_05090 [Gemmatimonadaceae bacterium]|nr:hypothetical protein [Gemmatimonadaceae bacterium]
MTVVQKLLGVTRSTMRKAAVVVAATQIMLGTAPLTESASRSSSAHVEASGVDLHHAHNEESCIACIAIKVFAGADLEQAPLPWSVTRLDAAAAGSDSFDARLADGQPRSRAPPSRILG